MFRKGNRSGQSEALSVYLEAADAQSQPPGDWSRHAEFTFTLLSRTVRGLSVKKNTSHTFKAAESDWGQGITTIVSFSGHLKHLLSGFRQVSGNISAFQGQNSSCRA